jgi:hypothetical protein
MRTLRTTLSLAAVLALAGEEVRADDNPAIKVIDRAIKAHGGEKALAKTVRMERSAQGKLVVQGRAVPFSEKLTAHRPDRMRMSMSFDGGKSRLLVVINKEKGWQSTGGAATELGDKRLADYRTEMYAHWLTTLLPLKDDGVTLKLLDEAQVNRRPAQVVRVSQKGQDEVTLYFDKKSGLLVKLTRPARDAGQTVDRAEFFSDHKKFAGVVRATKHFVYVDGKKTAEITVSSYQFPTKLDERLFNRP